MVLLKAATVFFLLLLVFFVLSGFVLRALRRGASIGAPAPARPSPKRIRLTPAANEPLRDPGRVESLARPLLDIGYVDAGNWRIEEIDLLVRLLLKNDDSVYAIAYDRHPSAGSWLDLVTIYADGSTFTANNHARPASLDDRPGHPKLRVPGAEPGALHARLLAERPARPMRPLTAYDLPALFEAAYAEEIAWRDARGGATDDEIRRIAKAKGKTLTDDEVKRARELLGEGARQRRRE